MDRCQVHENGAHGGRQCRLYASHSPPCRFDGEVMTLLQALDARAADAAAAKRAAPAPQDLTVLDEVLVALEIEAKAMSDAEITRQLTVLWSERLAEPRSSGTCSTRSGGAVQQRQADRLCTNCGREHFGAPPPRCRFCQRCMEPKMRPSRRKRGGWRHGWICPDCGDVPTLRRLGVGPDGRIYISETKAGKPGTYTMHHQDLARDEQQQHIRDAFRKADAAMGDGRALFNVLEGIIQDAEQRGREHALGLVVKFLRLKETITSGPRLGVYRFLRVHFDHWLDVSRKVGRNYWRIEVD